VCMNCLAFIDKCPVCRATFSEYIVFQKQKYPAMRVPHCDRSAYGDRSPNGHTDGNGTNGTSTTSRAGAGIPSARSPSSVSVNQVSVDVTETRSI
jgi:hypothetical protein